MELIRQYGRIVARKMGFIAVGWILVYFISQPFRYPGDNLNILMLFAPLIGGFAGLVAGWYMAQDSVEDSSLSGMTLWVILVLAAILPMWIEEGLFRLILRRSPEFGGFMVITAATLMALASAVWHASSQE